MGRAEESNSASSASVTVAILSDGFNPSEHHGERFVGAAFAHAQASHGFVAGGVAGEMITADAFDRHDAAPAKQFFRLGQIVILARQAVGYAHPQAGTTVVSRHSVGHGSDGPAGRGIRNRSARTS